MGHRIAAAAGGRPTVPVALETGHGIVATGGRPTVALIARHALVVVSLAAPVIFMVTGPIVPAMPAGRSGLAVPPDGEAGDRARGDRNGSSGERAGRGRAGMEPTGPECGRSRAAVSGAVSGCGQDVVDRLLERPGQSADVGGDHRPADGDGRCRGDDGQLGAEPLADRRRRPRPAPADPV
jgi:hypothetical protein